METRFPKANCGGGGRNNRRVRNRIGMNIELDANRGGEPGGGSEPIRDRPSRSWFILRHAIWIWLYGFARAGSTVVSHPESRDCGIERSRGASNTLCYGVPRLRCAPLGMTPLSGQSRALHLSRRFLEFAVNEARSPSSRRGSDRDPDYRHRSWGGFRSAAKKNGRHRHKQDPEIVGGGSRFLSPRIDEHRSRARTGATRVHQNLSRAFSAAESRLSRSDPRSEVRVADWILEKAG